MLNSGNVTIGDSKSLTNLIVIQKVNPMTRLVVFIQTDDIILSYDFLAQSNTNPVHCWER
jgi:hypothetical protein